MFIGLSGVLAVFFHIDINFISFAEEQKQTDSAPWGTSSTTSFTGLSLSRPSQFQREKPWERSCVKYCSKAFL